MKIKQIHPDENIGMLNWFTDQARAKGAQVVLTYPAYCQKGYDLNAASLDTLDQYYRKKLTCPVLGRPVDFALPDSLFFDTVYHLTSQGSKIRTDRLITLLSLYKSK